MKGIDKEHWIIYHMASKLYLPRKSTEDTENAHITSLKDKKLIVTMMDQSAEILCVLIDWLTVNTVYRLARNSWQAIPL